MAYRHNRLHLEGKCEYKSYNKDNGCLSGTRNTLSATTVVQTGLRIQHHLMSRRCLDAVCGNSAPGDLIKHTGQGRDVETLTRVGLLAPGFNDAPGSSSRLGNVFIHHILPQFCSAFASCRLTFKGTGPG